MKRVRTDDNGEKLFTVESTTLIDLKHKYKEGKAEGLKVTSSEFSY